MAEPSRPVLILGLGNPLRGDDGVGERVVEALREAGPMPDVPRLELRCSQQLLPELAEVASRCSGVVFVDARAGVSPGAVASEPVAPAAGPAPLSHALSPEAVLLYAERLYGSAPPAAAVTVGAERFDHGEALSGPVAAAVPEAVRVVRALARRWASA